MYGSMSYENQEVLQVSVTYGELYSDKEFTTEKNIRLKRPCPFCAPGTSSAKVPLYPCKDCKGNQYIEEIKKVKFSLPPGAKHGDDIKTKDADQNSRFVIKEIPDKFFQRRDEDLLLSMRITLNEAVNGFQIPVTLPDQHTTIIIKSPNERVIEHGSIYSVLDVGFPAGESKKRGALYIRFFVDMPTINVYRTMADKLAYFIPLEHIDCSDAQEVALEDM